MEVGFPLMLFLTSLLQTKRQQFSTQFIGLPQQYFALLCPLSIENHQLSSFLCMA